MNASSNKKTDTTNTENTFSTAKTADKPVSVVEDDVEMEGSTNVVAASTISSSNRRPGSIVLYCKKAKWWFHSF